MSNRGTSISGSDAEPDKPTTSAQAVPAVGPPQPSVVGPPRPSRYGLPKPPARSARDDNGIREPEGESDRTGDRTEKHRKEEQGRDNRALRGHPDVDSRRDTYVRDTDRNRQPDRRSIRDGSKFDGNGGRQAARERVPDPHARELQGRARSRSRSRERGSERERRR